MKQRLAHLRSVEEWERVEGSPAPIGATWVESEKAWNFALFSRHATVVTLLLYGARDLVKPVFQLRLDPLQNKTGRIWHCFVPQTSAPGARYYAYRVEGPSDPAHGHRFDPQKILFDAYAAEVHLPPDFSREAACKPGANDGHAPLGVLPKQEPADAKDAAQPPRHTHGTIVYELHVKGFTARANSGVAKEKRGTFLGLIEKISYLKELGITVVELLPVHQFDPQEANYWGYMTLSFFAPHGSYSVRHAVAEFREMVKAFHAAGIEVWLDVVYNHTCEGDEHGPTYSWRGIDNSSYYLITPEGHYRNYSGCGNALRCSHPASRVMILRSLRHWANLGVDGFRFDLASILARDTHGKVQTEDASVVSEISALAAWMDLRVVAEAWDIDAYLLGRCYPGLLWRQWNGLFRDDVRAFVKGDGGKVGALMGRLYGSSDLFPDGSEAPVYHPYQSVNFITAHDGFCLYDLVAYNNKHNESNGHGNNDGCDNNMSWNCGWEGDEGAPAEVLALRRRQVKNFFALLMLSNGTPMFCAGDEFLNTQRGNNNPYNQDNETTWLDWSLLEKNRDMFRFFQRMIAFRKTRPTIGRSRYWREDVSWYGANGPVDLGPDSHSLAYCLHGDSDVYVMINAYWEPIRFQIQEGKAGQWRRIVDTGRPSPEDITERPVNALEYNIGPRSVVIMEER